MKSYKDIFQSSKKTSTKRLNLRILQKSDINYEYVAALNNESIVGMTEARHIKWTIKNTEEFLNLNNNSSNMLLIGVFLKENDIHIGNVRLSNISKIHKRTEISMLFYRIPVIFLCFSSGSFDFSMPFPKETFDFSMLSCGNLQCFNAFLKETSDFLCEGTL